MSRRDRQAVCGSSLELTRALPLNSLPSRMIHHHPDAEQCWDVQDGERFIFCDRLPQKAFRVCAVARGHDGVHDPCCCRMSCDAPEGHVDIHGLIADGGHVDVCLLCCHWSRLSICSLCCHLRIPAHVCGSRCLWSVLFHDVLVLIGFGMSEIEDYFAMVG